MWNYEILKYSFLNGNWIFQSIQVDLIAKFSISIATHELWSLRFSLVNFPPEMTMLRFSEWQTVVGRVCVCSYVCVYEFQMSCLFERKEIFPKLKYLRFFLFKKIKWKVWSKTLLNASIQYLVISATTGPTN